MLMNNEREDALESLKSGTCGYVGQEAVNAALTLIPLMGHFILSLQTDLWQRRLSERVIEMFRAIDESRKNVEENKINKEFFRTEEFQTLVYLAVEMLRTTHEENKKRMLASALANSCKKDFASEHRKELFLRVLRDLSPAHIQVLQKLSKSFVPGHYISVSEPGGEELAILQYLNANGLVEQFSNPPHVSIPWGVSNLTKAIITDAVKTALENAAKRNFRISVFGLDFLKYLDAVSTDENGTRQEEGVSSVTL